MATAAQRRSFVGTIFTAGIITIVSVSSMTWLFNNAPGTNNDLALKSGVITAAAFLLLKFLRVA